MLTFIIAKKHTINYCDDMTMIKFTVNMFDMILYGIIYIYMILSLSMSMIK